jgi:cytochrome c-type biogenesis protein CcmH
MAINPAEFSSLQLLSLDAETNGDYQAAIGYWRLMIQVNPNSQQAQELRSNIAEAQQILAGPEGNGEQAGPRIEVNVELADGLEFPPQLRVFVAARNAEQEGLPPLAAIDMLVGDLPATVTLDNNLAVGPFNLSSASTVFITATVSRSGSATVQSGDFRVVSQNFAPNGEHSIIDLIISEAVP